ncbi:hypothetical protein GCM10023334_097670 [Nonomuraea thailandensis]
MELVLPGGLDACGMGAPAVVVTLVEAPAGVDAVQQGVEQVRGGPGGVERGERQVDGLGAGAGAGPASGRVAWMDSWAAVMRW